MKNCMYDGRVSVYKELDRTNTMSDSEGSYALSRLLPSEASAYIFDAPHDVR